MLNSANLSSSSLLPLASLRIATTNKSLSFFLRSNSCSDLSRDLLEPPYYKKSMETTSETPIPLAAVRTWHDTNPCASASDSDSFSSTLSPSPSSFPPPRFRVDEALNRKLALWNGAIWRLQVGAVTNSTNEALNDTSGLCRRLMDAAGSQVWVECRAAGTCRTGEAVLTRGCRLPARCVSHMLCE